MTPPVAAPRPMRPIVLAQTRDPAAVGAALTVASVHDGWIMILVNLNAAVFVGLVLLTAGYDGREALLFFGLHLAATATAGGLLLALTRRMERADGGAPGGAPLFLALADMALMSVWGATAAVYVARAPERAVLVIPLLAVAGIASAALSARLLNVMLLGRATLCAPALIWLVAARPENWGLDVAAIVVAWAISIAIGFAAYIQHLRQANIGHELRETKERLEHALAAETRSREAAARESSLREHFLRSVTHDLRQPINALGLFLRDIERRASGARERKAAAASQSCVAAANTIIESVSQLAWIRESLPPAEMRPTPLQPLFDRIVAECRGLAQGKGIALKAVPTSMWVRADPDYLERVTRNLVHNAIQYSDRGRILLGARRREGGRAEIQVLDTGRGIPETEREQVFEAFHQVKGEGGRSLGNIGLGLTIVRDLARAMGGEVTLASVEGRGSVFGVLLERTAGARTRRRVAQAADSRRALVVDDDPGFAAAARTLKSLGYEPRVVTDLAAIAAIGKADFDAAALAMVDYNLGDDLTALDLLTPHASGLRDRCVIVSQNDDPAFRAMLREKGWAFLRKPVTPLSLSLVIGGD